MESPHPQDAHSQMGIQFLRPLHFSLLMDVQLVYGQIYDVARV